ncbi:MAG: Pr6Pr family membrane protein [Vitreoscilla sp.]|nr:Pr6Pr family membrane protein [Polaromonas sp.]
MQRPSPWSARFIFLILRHTWKPEGAQFWVDAELHYAVPTLVVVFWAWTMPARSVLWKNAPWLFVYPLVYLAYVFARGELVRPYPYPFIDVLAIGYPAAVLNVAGMMVA